jgi:GH25 family lysozyme M1 (1,4-beta-N-acetylmuramidase)
MAGYSLLPPHPQRPWNAWTLWQYTGSGNAPGVTGACDRYRFRGSLAQFRAVMGLATPLDPGHERAGA